MNATLVENTYEVEINGEKLSFRLTPQGLLIKRKIHKDEFISYEDLIAKAENQLTMPI